jgi:hypothetical protein
VIGAALLLLLAVGAPAERPAWSKDVACPRMRRLHDPQLIAGREGDWLGTPCLDVDASSRICETWAEDGMCDLIYEREGRDAFRWHSACYLGPGRFDAWIGDLEGDGDEEIVVFTHEHEYCGIGTSQWQVAAFDRVTPRGAPSIMRVEDHDAFFPFTCEPDGGACRLFATIWGGIADTDGNWVFGRWYALGGRAWVADTSRPIVARRLYVRFGAAIGDAKSNLRPPLLWFASRDVREVDPSRVRGWRDTDPVPFTTAASGD